MWRMSRTKPQLTKINEETNDPNHYCGARPEFPCLGISVADLSSFHRTTIMALAAIALLSNPGVVATDNVISLKTSLWFWNQCGDNVIPHIHDVITRSWLPNGVDQAANRVPGFGVTIDIINGKLGSNKESLQADSRVKFRNFCSQLGVDPGVNLDCNARGHFTVSMLLQKLKNFQVYRGPYERSIVCDVVH